MNTAADLLYKKGANKGASDIWLEFFLELSCAPPTGRSPWSTPKTLRTNDIFRLAWECLRIPQGELESTDEGGRHLEYTAWPAALMTKLQITIRQWRDYIKYYP